VKGKRWARLTTPPMAPAGSPITMTLEGLAGGRRYEAFVRIGRRWVRCAEATTSKQGRATLEGFVISVPATYRFRLVPEHGRERLAELTLLP